MRTPPTTNFVGQLPPAATTAPALAETPTPNEDDSVTQSKQVAVDPTGIIVGAVVGALICILLLIVVLALVYRKHKNDAEINAIASKASSSVVYHSAAVFQTDMSNQSFAPSLAHSMSGMGTGSFTMQMGGGGVGVPCPHCTNTYPTMADVAIHVQKRHGGANSGQQRAWNESFSDASTVRYDASMPMEAESTVRYDTTMPMHSMHEPANYRGLAPYSTVGEERFSKFQN
jgi:hypothetical protein